MRMATEPQERTTITVKTEQRVGKLRELVDELEERTILSVDLSEVITDEQEDG